MKNISRKLSVALGLIPILTVSFIFSCGKMDDTYREFLSEGEITYVAKADSLKIRSGRERIQLEWLVMSDPKVKGYKVFWNNSLDSIVNDFNREVNGDTVRLIIDKLKGGVYEFEVFQFGTKGTRSVRASITGRSYDSSYESYLPNRTAESASFNEDEQLIISWNKYNNQDMLGIDFYYMSSENEEVNMKIPPNELQTSLVDYKKGTEIIYRTMYKPDSLSIDTFYSVFNAFTPENKLINAYLSKSYYEDGDLTNYLVHTQRKYFMDIESNVSVGAWYLSKAVCVYPQRVKVHNRKHEIS